MALLELIVVGVEDALDAESSGASRLELVSNIEQGGLTPDAATVEAVVRACRIPVMVMVRPSGDSFVADSPIRHAIREGAAMARGAGAAGIVFGALDERGEVDEGLLAQVVETADGLPITFHRAFDSAADLHRAYAALGRYRGAVAQVLSAGGAPTAFEGCEMLTALQQRHARGDGPALLVGSGVDPRTLPALHARIGAAQYHAGRGARVQGRFEAGIDAQAVAAMRRVIDGPLAALRGDAGCT